MALHRRDRVYPPTEPAEHARWVEAGYRRQERGVRRQRQFDRGWSCYHPRNHVWFVREYPDQPFVSLGYHGPRTRDRREWELD